MLNSLQYSNYSGIFLVAPAAAGEEKGKEARSPRAPARGLRPLAPLLSSYALHMRLT